jgi:hypothetical protein
MDWPIKGDNMQFKDLFDAKVHLLQSLATPVEYADGNVFEHRRNGTWREYCPSETCWHFRSNDGLYNATVHWYKREVMFYRTRKTESTK